MKPFVAIAMASSLAFAASAAWPVSAAPLRLSDFSGGRMALARADDARDQRHGHGTDDRIGHKAKGMDDPAGDLRRGRHADDPVLKSKGADDPAGDVRRGRGADDPANHR